MSGSALLAASTACSIHPCSIILVGLLAWPTWHPWSWWAGLDPAPPAVLCCEYVLVTRREVKSAAPVRMEGDLGQGHRATQQTAPSPQMVEADLAKFSRNPFTGLFHI